MSSPADRPARPGLTASDFLAAVGHYELNPDLAPDVRQLEQQLHQGLVRCAELAARLAHGGIRGQRLPSLYLPLAPEIRTVHDTVRGLQTRLRQARKQARETDDLAPLPSGETSATFLLARLALRIVGAVGEVGSHLALEAWVQQVEEQAGAYPDDHAEEEDEDYQHGGRGETGSGPCIWDISEERLAEMGHEIDFHAALASADAASQLRELFGVRFVFPDLAMLLRDARVELMELDLLYAPPTDDDPLPPDPEESVVATIDDKMMALLGKRPEEAIGWSKRRWSEILGCAHSVVGEGEAWKRIMSMREQNKRGKQESDREVKPDGRKRKPRAK